ncbi:UNVERIFIED_CONTAM: hypothetical protein GTU68_013279 [Idotea baltica]|nr:hypothetical protein [Idotea baltica]
MKSLVLALSVALLIFSPSALGQCLSDNDEAANEEVSTDLSGITDFSLDLFREIFPYNVSRNFFFSPYSIWNALTLAYFGSEGHTMMQLQKVLRTTDKVTAMRQWKQLQYMYEMRQINNAIYSFNLANKAFFSDTTVSIRPACLQEILKEEVQNIDFTKADMAAQIINDFVSNVTKARIPEIVAPGDVSNSRMALVNAAFFKGTWLYQFKNSATEKKLFYASPKDYYFVEMMSQKGNFRSGPSEELGAHILELPYSGGDISMVILLPPFIAGEEGFNQLVERLEGPLLHKAIDSLWRGEVEVSIPKFKLQESVGDELIVSLKNMGISDLFDSSLANLTAFDPAGGLNVGKTVHKAFVEVSEEGTEAAAATALIQFRVARPLDPEKFVCNHPFLFLIFDNATKNILFLGAYKNPKA